MHRLSRLLGVMLLLIAMVALVVDATKTLGAAGGVIVTSMAEQWQALAPQSFDGFHAWVDASFGDGIFASLVLPLLHLPAWAFFGVLGILLYWAGQKRRQVEIFIN